MIKYEPEKLLQLCLIICKNIETKYTPTELQEIYLKKAEEETKLKENEFLKIEPKEIFYLKKPKNNTTGFYKEFLETETVKKYYNELLEIIIYKEDNKEKLEELDKETEKFTNGKIKSFIVYYIKAINNYKEKYKNKIAIEKLREDYKI